MPEDLDQAKIVAAVRGATEEVFSTMLSMPLVAQEAYQLSSKPAPSDGVMALLGLAGKWVGTDSLCCTPELARQISGKLLMAEFASVDQEVLDAVGEVTNMNHRQLQECARKRDRTDCPGHTGGHLWPQLYRQQRPHRGLGGGPVPMWRRKDGRKSLPRAPGTAGAPAAGDGRTRAHVASNALAQLVSGEWRKQSRTFLSPVAPRGSTSIGQPRRDSGWRHF